MNPSLLRNLSLVARARLLRSTPNPNLSIPSRLFSSEIASSKVDTVEDVSNEELKEQIENYFKGNEDALPSIFESILRRKLTAKHADSDDELSRNLQTKPLKKISTNDFERDFDKFHETDREVDNLYDPKSSVVKKLKEDEYFYMTDKKWNELVKDGIKQGIVKDTRQCEDILEEMLNWDKLIPDHIRKMVEARFDELGDMCERGEIEPEEAYKRFKEYEDKLVDEYTRRLEAATPRKVDDNRGVDKKKSLAVPQEEGPILRWKTRVVVAPGGNSWHPKNRKVKLWVKVKALGLSKYEFRRLIELVEKRYHPETDELVITSERFEHREENRKDCLRTLLALIKEAKKAEKLVDDALVGYVKERLRETPAFMERLRAKATGLRRFNIVANYVREIEDKASPKVKPVSADS